MKEVLLATLGYTISTFALAVGWHVVLFERQYQAFGYFEGKPSFLIGLITIILQGLILSILFPMVRLTGSAVARGLKFSAIIGLFFWTSHVLAFVAKQSVPQASMFVLMESLYLVLQFGVFGLLLGIIHKNDNG